MSIRNYQILTLIICGFCLFFAFKAYKNKPVLIQDDSLQIQLNAITEENSRLKQQNIALGVKAAASALKIDSLQALKPKIKYIHDSTIKVIDGAGGLTIAMEFERILSNANLEH